MIYKCGICHSNKLRYLLTKPSKDGRDFDLFQCKKCKTVQVFPLPTQKELDSYYSAEYFNKRSDRGYDNYYSNSTKTELRRVWKLNLEDLGVYEDLISRPGRCMDIGCAAGFYLDYMKELGWDAFGVEIAKDPIQYGRNTLGLNIHEGDFLKWDLESKEKFQLITLWASLEHLRDPISVLKKIKNHLSINGKVLLSTCRWGIQSQLKQQSWRFLNVPEHLFYFGWSNIVDIMLDLGFKKTRGITYGSGYTSNNNSTKLYLLKKKFLDSFVKFINQGDMMALAFQIKETSHTSMESRQ